jgi:isoleucyl-tRNA synthetase
VADEALIDEDLSFRMGAARQVVNLGRAARNATQIKTRQPVAKVVIACREREQAAVQSLAAVVTEELNVKALEFVASASDLVSYVVKPNFRTLGPKFGKNMPAVAAAVAALPADETGDRIAGGRSVMVTVDGEEHEFTPEDFAVETHQKEGYQVEREGGLAVAISTALTPELVSEGLARELVHHIQNTRKAADFQIDDRIRLRVAGPSEVAEMLAVHGEWVKKETLASSLETVDVAGGAAGAGTGGAGTGGAGSAGASGLGASGEGVYREEIKVNSLAVVVEVAKA